MTESFAVFLFRRDLRAVDNVGFRACCTAHTRVLPLFIFKESQIEPRKNSYYSKNAVQFLLESLEELHSALPSLTFFHTASSDVSVLSKLHAKYPSLSAVHFNADVTPYAKKRDLEIQKWCAQHNIACVIHYDYNLLGDLSTRQPYQVFGAFFKKYGKQSIDKPTTSVDRPRETVRAQVAGTVPANQIWSRYFKGAKNASIASHGGRSQGLALLKRIQTTPETFKAYDSKRDLPALDATTHLSAYLKFGCISIREAYHAIVAAYGASHGLIKQFFWREFYDQIAVHFPHVLQGKSMRREYDAIQWRTDAKGFAAWKKGMTGFPIVDAGMRQIATIGFMHNRLRMIVASFLTKDLGMDWRVGEKYFAQSLVDYHPPANNGGWQWVAGSGADAQPYFRIFNPWLQSKRFDKDAAYIKHWVPELRDVPAKDIHTWFKTHDAYRGIVSSYPAPIVDHAVQAKESLRMIKAALKK